MEADVDRGSPPDGPRPPSQLSRDAILEAAVEFIDRYGLAKLTMRRLGAACGVEAMALYRYVHGRGDLLTGVVDHIIDRLYDDQLAARRQEDGWQDYLVRLAHGVRQVALDHPEVFPLVATQAPEAPWVRPPLRSLRWMESFLDTLISYGFDDDAAVAAYRAYTTFLIGQLLLEVSAHGAVLHPDEAILERGDRAGRGLADYPQLRRLQPMLAQDRTATEFEEALEVTLDRLELLLARR
ncbi:putative transcriptional regulator, TetR family protein [Mycolicibacterium insubricum]|uniref:TetR family transcriptional regulator n=1 Tax=Mycolicibacterium insubricum TaxID=444597 RepID=A0A1X0DE83_9MYCO|nr:TetR/AcrR family transcriptional regulator C-terminal domain-containing protein [Mycolicibacterium insubricum]ORA70685.1 TetR family transcriptional regulator [Mycolicibacterium insubricum]BBZ66205.1 putative transcriptional regulator, TetR family protein [Mycolicibacterium insubricum]